MQNDGNVIKTASELMIKFNIQKHKSNGDNSSDDNYDNISNDKYPMVMNYVRYNEDNGNDNELVAGLIALLYVKQQK